MRAQEPQAASAKEQLAPVESAAEFFAPENLLKVEITMDPGDWDKVRFDKRGAENSYTYQPGEISINGHSIGKVGVRKKGFVGSLTSQRPSLKIKFNEFKKGGKYLGLDRLTLNNNHQDPSQVKQLLSYAWFERADVPAPRCNLARVFVNEKDLGIYSNVESVRRPFLLDRFGSDEGNLYESTAGDFVMGDLSDFEAKTNRKNNDYSDLRRIIGILDAGGEDCIPQLEEYLDLDQFVRFWVAELLLGHWDGYAGNRNNYFVYNDPGRERFVFMPWGTDQTFSDDNVFIAQPAPKLIKAKGRLCALLYSHEDYRQIFLDAVAAALEDWWAEEELLAELDLAAELIRPHMHLADSDFDAALDVLREHIEGVATELWEDLAEPPEKWLVAPSSGSNVQAGPAGTASCEFLVPLDFFDVANTKPLLQSRIKFEWRGKPVPFLALIGQAGYRSKEPRWHEYPVLMLGGVRDLSGEAIFFYLSLDPEILATTHEFELDMYDAQAWFGKVTADQVPVILGSLRGSAYIEIVERDGKRFLEGTADLRIMSGLQDL
ncbi:MAG: CotH kinase family protein [Planctomycetota bacterium]